jgi:chromosome segregation ATPase
MLGDLVAVETVMIFAIGFLLAMLVALMLVPLVHRRAVRLTERRLDDAIPNSLKDMSAQKDLMRAKFAVATRELEGRIDVLKARTYAHLNALGEKREQVNRLQSELADKTERLRALEAQADALTAREQELHDALRAARAEGAARTEELTDAERVIAYLRLDMAGLTAKVAQRSGPFLPRHDREIARAAEQVAANGVAADAPHSTAELIELGKSMLRPDGGNGAARNGRSAPAP